MHQRQRKENEWGADDDDVVFVVPQPFTDLLKLLHEIIETNGEKLNHKSCSTGEGEEDKKKVLDKEPQG